MTQLTTEELVQILHIALGELRQDVEPGLLASKILCLTATYNHPGTLQSEITKYVKDLTPSAASRHIMDWSFRGKTLKPGDQPSGMEFIQQQADPLYPRRNLLHMTPKGLQYLSTLTDRVNEALQKRAVRSAKSA
ncbi:hypothetical protein ACDH70_06950 [Xanthomonas axonopodis pv. poinsettiicola]|uniref:hypothetical protein n=1 Tax=Xanthomonas TaxID=338 RepID=UPI001369C0DE|nr:MULTISPECIES: hypothetical protein [Xanthomonas]MBB4768622.1 DNA-binding MarR family transcriptional regulator [Xanthomonas arboricola]MCC8538799.1 hypothetical protein [Xanthomonas codiaei]MXV46575.1 hypothetical protein [Xanthomonas sp. LMG 8993]